MKCPYCGDEEDRVLESRPINDGLAIRRRRQCVSCSGRFTSYERIEESKPCVVKRDGSRQIYDRERVVNGLLKAAEKRPISLQKLEEIADAVERKIHEDPRREIQTEEIGEIIMKELNALDQVAYVRFASVYRQFKDVNDFVKEIEELNQ